VRKLSVLLIALLALTSCEKDTDVVVVGSGSAGFAAAIEAAKGGAKVVLLEKLEFVGGSTLVSGGVTQAALTETQKAAKVEDSADALEAYWVNYANGQVDKDLVHKVAQGSAANIDWLASNGVKWVGLYWSGTQKVNRVHVPAGDGPGYIKALAAAAKAAGVTLVTGAKATKLLTNDQGRVTGVEVVREGKTANLNAKAVILATGGFAANPQLVAQYAPAYTTSKIWTTAGNTGDGLLMAQALGADVVGHKGIIGFWAVAGEKHYDTEIAGLGYLPLILVNVKGERFVDETTHYALIHKAISEQANQAVWALYDGHTTAPALEKALAKGVAFKADTVEALARVAGFDAAGATKTVAAYNVAVPAGSKPLDTPVYWAVKIDPISLGTLTGLKIDLNSRVLNTAGQPIVGLYAAGEVANGTFFNDTYPGSGSSLQMCVATGRAAAQHALTLK